MGKGRKIAVASLLALLLFAFAAPLTIAKPVSAETTSTPVTLETVGDWTYIRNDVITIVFPAGGKKPMFLWWYTNDPDNINVVKFKGLIEYSTYEKPYFLWRCQSERVNLRQQIQNYFVEPRRHMMQEMHRMMEIFGDLDEIGNFSGLHAPYLPFSSSVWRLDGPENVTRGDVKYLSFNFTLVDVPGRRDQFQFAENNTIIRARFYYTPATEDAYGKYTYNVNAGELKIDIVIKKWDWNIDKINNVIQNLRSLGLDIPMGKAGLALWVNLASINVTKLNNAAEDTESFDDSNLTESSSMARDMYVEDKKVSVTSDDAGSDEVPMQNPQHFRIGFETGNTTFAGYFKFVPQAIVTDGTTYNTTDVTASYVGAGAHLRLFIGYPYFGNLTLEHDPSIGVEAVSSWLPMNMILILVGATAIIAVAVAAVKVRKRTVNIVNPL